MAAAAYIKRCASFHSLLSANHLAPSRPLSLAPLPLLHILEQSTDKMQAQQTCQSPVDVYEDFFKVLANRDRGRYEEAATMALPTFSTTTSSPVKHAFDAPRTRQNAPSTSILTEKTPIVVLDEEPAANTATPPTTTSFSAPTTTFVPSRASSTSPAHTEKQSTGADALIDEFKNRIGGLKDMVKDFLQDSQRRFRPLAESTPRAAKRQRIVPRHTQGLSAAQQMRNILDDAIYQEKVQGSGTWPRAAAAAVALKNGKDDVSRSPMKPRTGTRSRDPTKMLVPVQLPAWARTFDVKPLESTCYDDYRAYPVVTGMKRKLVF